jgi:hypothetical protein
LGLGEKEEKPFWAKFLRSDYLQEDDDGPLLPKVLDVLEGNKGLSDVVDNGHSMAMELFLNDDPEPTTP